MWKQLRSLQHLHKMCTRTYLSQAYQCSEAWNARLKTPILEKIEFENYLFELDQKYQQHGKFSSIDIDICCNKLQNEEHIDELFDILHKLRMSEETSNTMDSTHHAVVRNLISLRKYEELLQILNDPLNFGIFLDNFSANLALDTFIEAQNFTFAAKVASMLMLQEDFGNDITKSLSLLGCWKYLENPEPFEKSEEAEIAPAEGEKKRKKKPEEVRIRVKYLRNAFFDDHFDLRDHQHLVGKTLYYLGLNLPNAVGRSIQILGLSLFGKFEEGTNFVNNLKDGEEVYSEVLAKSLDTLKGIETPEEKKGLQEFIVALEAKKSKLKANEAKFEEEILKMLSHAIAKCEKEDIASQHQIYEKWCQEREDRLNEELLRLRRAQTVKDIEKMTKDMETEEQKLWFFENEDQIDLQIEKKRKFYPKRWFGKKKKPRVQDVNYVPPEIVKN
ncbi:small ribosomal subunit protein mS27 [Phlebotomus argentipes]|uniref:small ribosomal subunit protein mS27 n=1 Tax=Phlebotomus argentipes TaxID=94469 RepID=UPI0028933E3E|nr:small ribosomal subunit protein mS27 [Phlebotomus argentipes]